MMPIYVHTIEEARKVIYDALIIGPMFDHSHPPTQVDVDRQMDAQDYGLELYQNLFAPQYGIPPSDAVVRVRDAYYPIHKTLLLEMCPRATEWFEDEEGALHFHCFQHIFHAIHRFIYKPCNKELFLKLCTGLPFDASVMWQSDNGREIFGASLATVKPHILLPVTRRVTEFLHFSQATEMTRSTTYAGEKAASLIRHTAEMLLDASRVPERTLKRWDDETVADWKFTARQIRIEQKFTQMSL